MLVNFAVPKKIDLYTPVESEPPREYSSNYRSLERSNAVVLPGIWDICPPLLVCLVPNPRHWNSILG